MISQRRGFCAVKINDSGRSEYRWERDLYALFKELERAPEARLPFTASFVLCLLSFHIGGRGCHCANDDGHIVSKDIIEVFWRLKALV